jgi:hypothetical protein
MRRIGLQNCPYCGRDDEIYTSHPNSVWDELCCFFFLQVVRCHSCMRRYYRPLVLRPVPIAPAKKPIQAVANNEQRKQA